MEARNSKQIQADIDSMTNGINVPTIDPAIKERLIERRERAIAALKIALEAEAKQIAQNRPVDNVKENWKAKKRSQDIQKTNPVDKAAQPESRETQSAGTFYQPNNAAENFVNVIFQNGKSYKMEFSTIASWAKTYFEECLKTKAFNQGRVNAFQTMDGFLNLCAMCKGYQVLLERQLELEDLAKIKPAHGEETKQKQRELFQLVIAAIGN